MSIFVKFAKKYFEEAKKDFERAKRAYQFQDYPECVFYCQQCVEKCVKAMLEVKRRVVYNQGLELISTFVEVFEREWLSEYNIIIEALEYLQEYYTRSRYPFLLKGEVLSPSDIIDRNVAERSLSYAEKVLEVTYNFLRRNNIV